MTTRCVVRAAERPSAAARELAPAVRHRKFVKDYSDIFVGDGVPDIPGGTYYLIKYGLYVIPSGFAI